MRDNDHERGSTSRRGYLGTIAGLAAAPALGSLAGADPEDVITIVGRGSTAHYEFTVSGSVEKVTADGATINSYDAVSGSTVTGRTTHEPDAYAFDGEIDDFESDAPVDVTINGEPAALGEDAEGDRSDTTDVDESAYSNVVDIVEAGADDSGDSSITSVFERVADDGTLVKFPPGEYLMSGTARLAGYDKFGMVGEDATIDVAPTDSYVFKLGTYRSPIDDLYVEGFTADIGGSNTGGRVFELQAGSDLLARDIEIDGKHDTPSKGPMLVGLQTGGGEGLVENVSMPDGGEDVSGGRGGTGLLVSNYHEGTVTLRNVTIGPFPDNGIYCSNSEGTVQVEGGRFENANVAGVRLSGDDSYIEGAEFVYDEDIGGFGGQRPIRLDGGSNLEVGDVEIDMTIPQTEAIRVMGGVGSASIHDVEMDLSSQVRDGVSITGGAGSVETDDLDISGNSRYDVFNY